MALSDSHSPAPAILALEDGRVFHGESFGANATTTGEVCFNTSMTGYQEVLTDPSYRGQIVTMTYPEIGNTGINPADMESAVPHVRGFVIANLSPVVSNWRSARSLPDFLSESGIPGIQGIDTRALTKHLRVQGAMRGCLSTEGLTDNEAIFRARSSPPMEGSDFVREVTTPGSFSWDPEGIESRSWILTPGPSQAVRNVVETSTGGDCFLPLPAANFPIVAMDFGMKRNIARLLRAHGLSVTVVPSTASPAEILDSNPSGLFLSNGPGDPAALEYVHETVRDLLDKIPIFGICLGHQIIALALGAKTFKLKFGHRGANQPVQDHRTGAVAITSQNHGFAVDPESIPPEVEITHTNLNDRTVAGLRHKTLPVFSVQYHPEASPGPHDAAGFFAEFARLVAAHHSARKS